MDWRNTPAGVIRYKDLLNALLAIWQTQHNMAARFSGDIMRAYELGFEEGLDAVAQMAGLAEVFEDGKAGYRAQLQKKLNGEAGIITRHALLGPSSTSGS